MASPCRPPVMDYERLLELVRGHEELYNVAHSKYSDQQQKEAAWKCIALKLNHSAQTCKKAWVNLRDSFRRTIRKRKDSNFSSKKKRKWRYEDQMAFIIPHFQERETPYQESAPREENGDETVETIIKEESIDLDIPSLADSEDEMTQSNFQIDTDEPVLQEVDTASSNKFLECKQNVVNHTDALDLFLASMAATIRKFPPYYQSIAKSKIFTAVSDIELNLIIKNKSASPQPSSHKGIGFHFLETG